MDASAKTSDRYADALRWLTGRINYERVAALPYGERQLKLDRMRQLLTRLGSPDAGQRIVHIAGTKGKGSTAAMVASVLREAGYHVGVYSSPHLERIEERFAINGEPTSPETFVGLVDRLRPVVERMDAEAPAGGPASELSGPTFFDITTAMALLLFADQRVDVTVLEVGLGGRLDSTNVCHPVVAAITSIGLDHTKQLGDTLEAIAAEKAGIIKPGTPVISGEAADGPRGVIADAARRRGCRLIQRGADFGVETPSGDGRRFGYWSRDAGGWAGEFRLGLDGLHQAANAATALAVVDELVRQACVVSGEARRRGLAATRLPARVEWFPGAPPVVIDAAHNAPSAAALAAAVARRHPDRRHPERRRAHGGRTLMLACSRDKDAAAIAGELVATFDRFVVTRYVDNPRAIDPDELAGVLRNSLSAAGRSAPIATAPTPADAWRLALQQTPPGGVLAVTGSFFLAAEVRPLAVADRQPRAASDPPSATPSTP